MSEKNFFLHVFGGMWRFWDFLCRVVINLTITVVALFALAAIFGERHIIVPTSAALVVDLQGDLVEQLSGDPVQRALDRAMGRKEQPQTRLRGVVDAIERAATDTRIKALVLETDFLDNAGLSKLQDVGHAIADFRKTGKPVFALGDSYTQSQYYLASMADTVFIHPQGAVFLHGFGIYQPYFKDALDKLGVEWNVFRVGKYKSAVEPFMRNDMSPEAREDFSSLLTQLWGAYKQDVTAARKLKPGTLDDYINNLDSHLAAVKGDDAKLALDTGLVDRIANEDEMENAVARIVGHAQHSFRQIEYQDYLSAVNGESDGSLPSRDKVAVIVASGDIVPGDPPPGTIGSESTSELIREARYDDSIKALVFRVDSPGGSSFASDLILRELQLTREAGKPVIVSMGSLAASGGYWISMAGDEIYASPTTITGSIGIFGMLPTFQDTLAKVGIHSDGTGTTPLSDAFDLTRSLSPELKQALQLSIEHGYQEFITKVADYRHMKVADVDAIAQGRVWSGADAKRLGLVDKFGDLDDAVKEAAKLANVSGRYSVDYLEKPLSFTDRLLIGLANDAQGSLGGFHAVDSVWDLPWYRQLTELARGLSVFNDPRGVYAYCFCNVH